MVTERLFSIKYLNLLFLMVLLFLNSSHAAELGERKVGLEFEYAQNPSLQRATHVEDQNYLLSLVQNYFGGDSITVMPWNKWLNAWGTKYSWISDAQGRSWQAAPEQMDTDSFDGYELITPPLNSSEDIKKLQSLLHQLRKDNRLSEGQSSSTHFTFDISNLIEGNNVSKVVDLILFLESNCLEIFRAIGPKRYGKTINKYAVPLALNQKSLLHDLAALAKEQRTFSRVRDIFSAYAEREEDLSGALAWKTRAFNYGKFFGLGIFKELPIVEIRISDLVWSEDLKRVGDFFSTLIDVGASIPQKQFKDPFHQFDKFPANTIEINHLEEFIKNVPVEKYFAFLRILNLDQKKYPPRLTSNRLKCINLL